jgi:hypothetical protein
MNFHLLAVIFSFFQLIYNTTILTINDELYCRKNGGKVVNLRVQLSTNNGIQLGREQTFCQIEFEGNIGIIGLDVYASPTRTLVATYAKSLKIDTSKNIPGPFDRSSLNLCYKLGGADISYNYSGGFSNKLGQLGICYFGDGSAIADWTLFYIVGGLRNDIKKNIKSLPFAVSIPNINDNTNNAPRT